MLYAEGLYSKSLYSNESNAVMAPATPFALDSTDCILLLDFKLNFESYQYFCMGIFVGHQARWQLLQNWHSQCKPITPIFEDVAHNIHKREFIYFYLT